MNTSPRIAVLRYGASDFAIVTPGDFVRCAVTGALIPLDQLNYWSAEAQEAYASAAVATEAWLKRHAP